MLDILRLNQTRWTLSQSTTITTQNLIHTKAQAAGFISSSVTPCTARFSDSWWKYRLRSLYFLLFDSVTKVNADCLITPVLHKKIGIHIFSETEYSHMHEYLQITFVGWFTNPHASITATLHNNIPTQGNGPCLRKKNPLDLIFGPVALRES